MKHILNVALIGALALSTLAHAGDRSDLSFAGDLVDVLPQLRQLDPQMTITRAGQERDVPISVSVMNGAKVDILRAIGEQAGDKADLIYSPKLNQLKIEYKAAPQVVQAGAPAKKAAPALDPVRRHPDGSVEVVFGRAKPELRCQPYEVCGIELEPGEAIRNVDVGDAARWEVTPSVIGEDDSRTVVLVLRPTQPKLKTRLMVSTNRRLYSIFLASTDSADEAGDTRLYFQYPVRN